jgi:hypothetical protein
MKKLALMIVCSFLICAIMYALEYIESSNGLGTPELEGGRTEVEMADVNNDGNLDILSIGDHGSPYINTNEHGVMVWFGDGQGNWSVYQNGNFGYGGIAIGDLNNDGHMDIGYGMHHNYSSTDFGDSILEAALGDGTGQNWIAWDDGISTGGNWGMFSTDFADINNDGYLDIGSVSFGADDGVHLCINNGDGNWMYAFGFSGGNSTMFFKFGDVNGDGNADFAVGHQYGSIYLGDGAGNFTLADGNLPPGGNMGRRGSSLGDVNNDGNQDFVFTNTDGGIEVWMWNGSNNWVDYSGTLPISGSYYGTQLCDVDIDGYMDIAAFGDSTVTVWCGDGVGNWTDATTFYTPGPGDFSAFRVGGDADHNGYPDITLIGKEGDAWSAVNHLRFYKETSTPGSLFIFPVFPRGGETFIAGSVHFVDWTCGVPSGTALINLELSTTGSSGPWLQIIANTPNNCRYQWSIQSGISSDNCFIKYTAATQSDTSTAITPASFRIAPATSVKEFEYSPISQIRLQVRPTVSGKNIIIRVTITGANDSWVKVFDNSGKLIRKLLEIKGSGQFTIPWDRNDAQGRRLPSGTYFITLETDKQRVTKKIVVVR